jgi:hypothetical protein
VGPPGFALNFSDAERLGRREGQVEEEFALRRGEVDFALLAVPALARPDGDPADSVIIARGGKASARVLDFAN